MNCRPGSSASGLGRRTLRRRGAAVAPTALDDPRRKEPPVPRPTPTTRGISPRISPKWFAIAMEGERIVPSWRERVGIALACALPAAAVGALARQQLAEHWASAAAPGALWAIIGVAWAAALVIVADALRRA